MPQTININIPDSILENYSSVDEMEDSIYEDIVVSEFQKGNLSIREGAELLDLTYEGFMEFLGKRQISFVNATKDELEKSSKNFECFMQNYHKT